MDTIELVRVLRAHTSPLAEERSLSGTALARILQTITEHEVEEGGPYERMTSDGGSRIDLGMNLLIALFLSTYDVQLPNLDDYILSSLEDTIPRSVFFSEYELEELIERYTASREKRGATARSTETPLTEKESLMLERIRGAARTRFGNLSQGMQESARFVLERTLKNDSGNQIALISFYVREALGARNAAVTDEMVAALGLANVFFWSAASIYDDFWDEDEDAEPQHLPIATLFTRHFSDYFGSLFPTEYGFRTFFQDAMDTLDNANAWETRHCRMQVSGHVVHVPDMLPDYKDFAIKYYPAAGHVMGPIALFVLSGFALNSPEVATLTSYFTHLLIARQLNDDLHDWKEDLARGHISTVIAALLREWKRNYPESGEIHLRTDMPELERLFCFSVMRPLVNAVLSHSRKSRRDLSKLLILEDASVLERLCISSECLAREALREHDMSQEFLSAFIIP